MEEAWRKGCFGSKAEVEPPRTLVGSNLNSGHHAPGLRSRESAITGRDLWWIKIQLACSVSACSGVTVAGLQNRLRTRQLGEGD